MLCIYHSRRHITVAAASMGSSQSAPSPAAPTLAADAPKPKKICCACPDTRKIRDECVVHNGEDKCAASIEAHKKCLRSEGFDVRARHVHTSLRSRYWTLWCAGLTMGIHCWRPSPQPWTPLSEVCCHCARADTSATRANTTCVRSCVVSAANSTVRRVLGSRRVVRCSEVRVVPIFSPRRQTGRESRDCQL